MPLRAPFSAPGKPDESLLEEVKRKCARLHAAPPGKKFLVLPVSDVRDAASWIFASFFSPLTVVPIAAILPPPAREALLRQLPPDTAIEPRHLPEDARTVELREKPLSSLWAVIFSSGSSGPPKGVALSGHSFQRNAAAHAGLFGHFTWLLNLPLQHVGGFSVLTRAYFLDLPFAFGGEKFSVAETKMWVESGEVQGLSLVPTTLQRLTRELPKPPESLGAVLLGGAAATPALLTEARAFPIYRTYGMTEHGSQIATETVPQSGLKPLPGVGLRIAPDGEILIRSDALAEGYFQHGALHPLPKSEGFFPTGDIGAVREGSLELLGRKSELIISGGLNIFPAEIEIALADFSGLTDFAVTGISDPEWGEVVCAAIVADPSPASDRLDSFLRARLDPRKLPKRYVFLPSLPRSSLGKLLRHDLRALVEKKILEAR